METKRVTIVAVYGEIFGVEREYPDGRLEYADLYGNVVPDSEILAARQVAGKNCASLHYTSDTIDLSDPEGIKRANWKEVK